MSQDSNRLIAIYCSTVALAASFLSGALARVPFNVNSRRAVQAALIGFIAGTVFGKLWFLLTQISDEEEETVIAESPLGEPGQTDDHQSE
ncbi:MAG: hypothetical protein RL885_14375 [Planctomycetota bacterium]